MEPTRAPLFQAPEARWQAHLLHESRRAAAARVFDARAARITRQRVLVLLLWCAVTTGTACR